MSLDITIHVRNKAAPPAYQQLVEAFKRDAAGKITFDVEVGQVLELGPGVTSPIGLPMKWTILGVRNGPADLVSLEADGSMPALKAGEADIDIRVDDGGPV